MSFRNSPKLALLKDRTWLRERAGELTSQTLSLRGRAAAGVVGGATIGVLTLTSAVGAMASTGQSLSEAKTVAGVADVGEAGMGIVSPEQMAGGKKSETGRAGSTDQAVAADESGESTVAGKAGALAKAAAAKKAAEAEKTQRKAGSAEKQEPTAPTTDEVIDLAEEQIGITENDNGGTKFNEWYMSTDAAERTAARDGGSVTSYSGAAWCDMFVSWLSDKTGLKGMGADAYTVSHAEWFKESGRWGQEPKPGSVVFFAWGGGDISDVDHVGLVVKDNGDGTITTVGGNVDNAVKKKIRDKSEVAGYGYPDYRESGGDENENADKNEDEGDDEGDEGDDD